MSRPLTYIFLICFATFALVHNLAIVYSLYWFYWWFDIVMHFFGGVFISLGMYTLAELRLCSVLMLKPIRIASIALGVMVSWEVFELLAGVPVLDDFVIDTIIDLCVGGLGAWFGYYFSRRFITDIHNK